MDKLKRLIVIYRVVQVFLLGLLIFTAFHFQQLFDAKGIPQVFLNSILAAVLIQLLTFYPVRKFAGSEAQREAASVAPNLSADDLRGLRQKRIYSDILKAALFIFFTMFVLLAPAATSVMAIAFFSFLLIILTYAQCFTFSLSRTIRNGR